MATPKKPTQAAPEQPEAAASKPTDKTAAAQAARAVGVKADEVFAWRDHGTHLVVVTVDGRKLSTDDKTDESEKAAEVAQ